MNVTDLLRQHARDFPDLVGLKTIRDGSVTTNIRYQEKTFKELDALVDQTVRYLTCKSITPNMRVLLLLSSGVDLVIATFALLKMGAIPIVIDPGMGVRSFLKCVQRSQPQALIGTFSVSVLSILLGPFFNCLKIRLFKLKYRSTAFSEASTQSPVTPYSKDPDELAAILFTSGSTGFPKGVCYTHAIFQAQLKLIRNAYNINTGAVALSVLPVFHLFNPALGMTSVIPEMNPRKPSSLRVDLFVQTIQKCKVTNLFSAPTVVHKVTDYCLENNIQLISLHCVLIAGAPVFPELLKKLEMIAPQATIHVVYGATESLPLTSITSRSILGSTWQHTEQGKGTCVGTAFPDVRIRVIAAQEKKPDCLTELSYLPINEIGEIIVQGSIVTQAYDQLPEATANRVIETSSGFWARTGDLGYIDDEGRLWLCGRQAEQVISGQGTFYPVCCEAHFNRHPKVFRSALISFQSPEGILPAIVVQPQVGWFPKNKSQRECFIEELKAYARSLPTTRSISTFFFHENFPVDVRHNAKIHRLTLAKKFNNSNNTLKVQ
jgi:acyl-CoA synthetase (AMP-forming)/AMP-acid ligase II